MMKKTFLDTFNWLKKNWKFTLAAMAILLFATAQVIRLLTPPTQPPVGAVNTWQGITPGYSTLDDVYQKLGTPIKTEETAQGTRASYKSVFPAQPNAVVADKQQKVQFIKEYVLVFSLSRVLS